MPRVSTARPASRVRRAQQGAQGPKGDQGPQGPQGQAGIHGATVVTNTGTDGQDVTAICEDGKIVIGGGVETSTASGRNVSRSAPTTGGGTTPKGWVGKVTGNGGANGTTTVHAICVPAN